MKHSSLHQRHIFKRKEQNKLNAMGLSQYTTKLAITRLNFYKNQRVLRPQMYLSLTPRLHGHEEVLTH